MKSPSSKKYGLAVHCIMWRGELTSQSSATELVPVKPAAEYVQAQTQGIIDLFLLLPPPLFLLLTSLKQTENLPRDIYGT